MVELMFSMNKTLGSSIINHMDGICFYDSEWSGVNADSSWLWGVAMQL